MGLDDYSQLGRSRRSDSSFLRSDGKEVPNHRLNAGTKSRQLSASALLAIAVNAVAITPDLGPRLATTGRPALIRVLAKSVYDRC